MSCEIDSWVFVRFHDIPWVHTWFLWIHGSPFSWWKWSNCGRERANHGFLRSTEMVCRRAGPINFELHAVLVDEVAHELRIEDLHDRARRSYVASGRASGTNIERFRSLFNVPSILEQSECPPLHIDTDSAEHHGKIQPYRERMDFLNFRYFRAFFTQFHTRLTWISVTAVVLVLIVSQLLEVVFRARTGGDLRTAKLRRAGVNQHYALGTTRHHRTRIRSRQV